MPAHTKPTPLRFCQHCGSKLERKRLPNGDLEYLIHFNRRKFCDLGCSAKASSERPKTSDPSWSTAHYHARKLCPPGPCAKCGSTGPTDVHHKDEDWQNNSPTNLERLCRSCHMQGHSQPTPCSVCGLPQKGLGLCEKHYQRFKKWGDPTMVKDNQFTPLRKDCDQHPKKGCQVLDCTGKYHARGYCSKHAQQERRGTLGQPQMTKSEASLARWW